MDLIVGLRVGRDELTGGAGHVEHAVLGDPAQDETPRRVQAADDRSDQGLHGLPGLCLDPAALVRLVRVGLPLTTRASMPTAARAWSSIHETAKAGVTFVLTRPGPLLTLGVTAPESIVNSEVTAWA